MSGSFDKSVLRRQLAALERTPDGIDYLVAIHQWLCHPGRKCDDGCQEPAIPVRLALYKEHAKDIACR